MKSRALPLLALCSLFLLSGIFGCGKTKPGPKPVIGTLYVKKTGEDGVFSKKEGEILDVTPRKIKIKVKSDSGSDEELIYIREVVAQVLLDDNADQRWKEIVREDWNREPSKTINALQIVVSSILPATFWREVHPIVRIFIIIFVMILLLFLGTHRLYLMFVVAREERTLNQAKLGMEISKLHYDIQSVKKNLKLITEIPPDDLKEVLKATWLHEEIPGWQEFLRTTRESKLAEMEAEEPVETAKDRPESPKVEKPVTTSMAAAREAEMIRTRKVHFSTSDFVKHTIFRIQTEEQKNAYSEFRRKKWRQYEGEPAWMRISRKWVILAWFGFWIIECFLFSLGSFIDIFLPYIDPTIGEEIPFIPLIMTPIFLGLFIVFFGFFLQLWSKQKIIRTTYSEIFDPQE